MMTKTLSGEELLQHIRSIPDFPSPGILFRDITPLLQNGEAFRMVIRTFADRYAANPPDRVLAIESRGLIFGAAIAYELGVGLALARKPGKLPSETFSARYVLEYGKDALEMHKDAIKAGDRVLIVDDLLATGGTIGAAVRLVEQCGGRVMEIACVLELEELKGRERLSGLPVMSLAKV